MVVVRSDQRSIVVASGEQFRFQPGTYQAEHGLDGHIRCSGSIFPHMQASLGGLPRNGQPMGASPGGRGPRP